ncbi:MAG: hypothetical protein AB7F89_20435 [Pirellulaceae bacterium]
MWHAFLIAIGVAALILGGEFLVIERATLTLPVEENLEQRPLLSDLHQATHSKEFVPPEWAPWTLLSFGAVMVLYSTSAGKE